MKPLPCRLTLFLIAAALASPAADAKNKHDNQPAAQPQDQITVDAHIPASQGSVTGFMLTRHHDRRCAYGAVLYRNALLGNRSLGTSHASGGSWRVLGARDPA